MAEDSEGTVPESQPPETDTADATQNDTPENTPETPPVDFEKRYKDAQAELTRKSQYARQLEDRLLELQEHGTSEAPPADETPREKALRLELERSREREAAREMERVRSRYSPEWREAIDRFDRTRRLDPSPAGMYAALEAAVDELLKPSQPDAPKPPAETPAQARAKAAQPISNQSARPAPDLKAMADEAEKSHSDGDAIAWLGARMGWGRHR